MPPVVAVVGRPNVGKSTLVNRILGRREAIVEERPGVTRDRKTVEADWNGREFLLVDTGGWLAADAGLESQVSRQAERAVAEADVVLLVVDATVGVTVVALTGTRPFPLVAIQVTGAPSGLIAETDPPTVSVVASGTLAALAALSPGDVVASVDASGKTAGTSTVDVVLKVPAGITVTSLQPIRVTLTMRAR